MCKKNGEEKGWEKKKREEKDEATPTLETDEDALLSSPSSAPRLATLAHFSEMVGGHTSSTREKDAS